MEGRASSIEVFQMGLSTSQDIADRKDSHLENESNHVKFFITPANKSFPKRSSCVFVIVTIIILVAVGLIFLNSHSDHTESLKVDEPKPNELSNVTNEEVNVMKGEISQLKVYIESILKNVSNSKDNNNNIDEKSKAAADVAHISTQGPVVDHGMSIPVHSNQSQPACHHLPGHDLNKGHDLATLIGYPESRCCGFCASIPRCVGYTWGSKDGGTCWLRDRIKITPNSGVNSGILL